MCVSRERERERVRARAFHEREREVVIVRFLRSVNRSASSWDENVTESQTKRVGTSILKSQTRKTVMLIIVVLFMVERETDA